MITSSSAKGHIKYILHSSEGTIHCYFTVTFIVEMLNHWGRVTHICIGKPTIIGSDNGLSPERRQAIIWTNAGILLIVPLWTNLSENLIEILTFSFTKMRLKVSSAKWRPFCFGLNVLTLYFTYCMLNTTKWLTFADDIFKCLLLIEKWYVLIQISLFLRVQLTISQRYFL